MRVTTSTCLVCSLCVVPLVQADSQWAAPISGSYGTSTFWTPQDVPDSPNELATIGWGPTAYTVTLDASSPSSTTIGGLLLTNPAATLSVENGRSLVIATNTFENAGIISLDSSSGSHASLVLSSSTTLEDGLIRMGRNSVLQVATGAVLTNHARIEGGGHVEGAVINSGVVEAQAQLRLSVGAWTNEGTIRAIANGRIKLDDTAIFNESGEIEAADGIVDAGGVSRIVGGVVRSTSNGSIEISARGELTLQDAEFHGIINILHSADLIVDGYLDSDGLVVVNSDSGNSTAQLVVTDGGSISGMGQIQLRSGSASVLSTSGHATVGVGQRLFGRGHIEGDWDILGVLSPGNPTGDLFPFATIDCVGGFHLFPSSRLEVEIASTAPNGYDRIQGADVVSLDGTLVVQFIGTYLPHLGDSVEIVQASSVSGRFGRVIGPAMPAGLVLRASYGASSARVQVVCTADVNADGLIDFFDLQDFLNQFSQGDVEADLNDDSVLDFFDVQAFLQAYSDGCP